MEEEQEEEQEEEESQKAASRFHIFSEMSKGNVTFLYFLERQKVTPRFYIFARTSEGVFCLSLTNSKVP